MAALGRRIMVINKSMKNSNIGTEKGTFVSGQDDSKSENIQRKEFSELQKCDGDIVDSVVIDTTSVDVNVHQWTSSNITVKFEGEANVISGDIEFECYIIKRKLYVTTSTKGNITDQDLKLDVWLPPRLFSSLTVKGTSSNVCINKGVYARFVEVQTSSGNIRVGAAFVKSNLKTNEGDVELSFNAQSRIDVKISTISGNISISPSNVRKFNLSAKTKHGKVKNNYHGTYGYVAMVNASSKDGNIIVM